ncbi:MAG: Histone H1-like nucleoprotein [Acidimicrobiaceae bacterium]|nr:Histone H1-like nucleoprotein [Acidimicrobiaceae bacterium]
MDAPTVRLVDLDVIKRFSLAVRAESAPAADVLAALEASRVAVLEIIERVPDQPAARRPRKVAAPQAEAVPAKRSVAKGSVAKKSVAKRSVAKKAVAEGSVAKKSVAKGSVAKRSVAKKSAAKKA